MAMVCVMSVVNKSWSEFLGKE